MQSADTTGKLIATDLDGTLFNEDSLISERTLAALKSAKDSGHETIAVTGRSWRTAFDRLKPAAGIDYIVCSNGAYLYRQTSARIGWANSISRQDTLNLVSQILVALPTACFGWESESGLHFDPKFRELAGRANSLESGGSAGELGSAEVYKLFVRTPHHHHTEVLSTLTKEVGHSTELSTSGAPFVELTASGTDKASGLARVAEELGYSADATVVFGDNLNDLPMFEWAGTSVAMGNAVPEVKRIATHLTTTNTDDGVAQFLEQLISA